MRRLRFILLLLSLALIITALASCSDASRKDDNSGVGDSTADDGGDGSPGCDHFWLMGYCRLCEAVCSHEWKNARCTVCDMCCLHSTVSEDKCETCGKQMKAARYSVTVVYPISDGANTESTLSYFKAMYLDEILSYELAYIPYTYRYELYDITLNGEKINDCSILITTDSTVELTYRQDAVRVNLTLITLENRESTEVIYLPKNGISLEKIALIVSPTSDSFSKVLNKYNIKIDGQPISDGGYVINKDCSVQLTERADSDYITVKFCLQTSNMTIESDFKKGIKLSDALSSLIFGYRLDDMLMKGELFLNGERIFSDVELNGYAEIDFYENTDGYINVNFRSHPDLGIGTATTTGVKVKAGSTYEEIVYEMFGYTWEEYENAFYNTRTDNGAYTEWQSISKDTVISKPINVAAIQYHSHEEGASVKLTLNITDIYQGEVTVPYGTPLSVAFGAFDPALDFDVCLEEWDMFINTIHLVGDAKLKYNSFIYGEKRCTEHEWEDRTCTKCGILCNFEYNAGNCPVCGSVHPTFTIDKTALKIEIYCFDANGTPTANYSAEIESGKELYESINLAFGLDPTDMDENGYFVIDGERLDSVFDYGIPKFNVTVEYYENSDSENN